MEKLVEVRLFNGSDIGREISVNPEQIVKIEDVFEETNFENIFLYSLMTLTDGTTYKLEDTSDKLTHLINKI
jgi:hypothetical protein